MSYEGFNQCICEAGHYFTHPETYGNSEMACDVCGDKPVWVNAVDETNGESTGFIFHKDMEQFRSSKDESGHWLHRSPDAAETLRLRNHIVSWQSMGNFFVPIWEKIPYTDKDFAEANADEYDRIASENKKLQKLAKRK